MAYYQNQILVEWKDSFSQKMMEGIWQELYYVGKTLKKSMQNLKCRQRRNDGP